MAFKDDYRDFGEIARELHMVRQHNKSLAEEHRKGVPEMLMFSEGLLVLLALERFLRIILGAEAAEDDTLPNLLEKATSARLKLLELPSWWPRGQTIKAMKDVRNALMHGNYDQAAKQSGAKDRTGYFRDSIYINEVETLFRILDGFCTQIDPDTGTPREPRPAWPERFER